MYGSLDVVKYLLENGADPNDCNSLGETPLHQATDMSLFEITQILLEFKADPNQIQTDGNSPLHNAVRKNNKEIVKILLDHGADPNLQEFLVRSKQFGKTSLHIAAENKNKEIFEMLLEAGSDLAMQDLSGRYAEMNEKLSGSDDSSEEIPARAQTVYSIANYKETDQLYSWLRQNRLDELFPILVKYGFNDIKSMKNQQITEKDLIEMKIKKSGLRVRLLNKLEEEHLGNHSNRNKKLFPDMHEWMEDLQLGNVWRILFENGFYYIEDLVYLQNNKKMSEVLAKIGLPNKEIFRLGVLLYKLENECTEKTIESVQRVIEKRSLFDCGFCSAFKNIFN